MSVDSIVNCFESKKQEGYRQYVMQLQISITEMMSRKLLDWSLFQIVFENISNCVGYCGFDV